jgi:hypothetical protein
MEQSEPIGPHAEFESFLNHVDIYNRSVLKLLNDPPSLPGIHYHLGILQVSLAVESLLSKIYLEFIFPKLPNDSYENIERLSAEARWYLAPILIQSLRGKSPRYFDRSKMPYQGLGELIKFRNATAHPKPDFKVSGKLERPFTSDDDPEGHLPRRTFWDRQEWPLLRIHKHPECVSYEELKRTHDLFLSLIKELSRLTDDLVTFEWATEPIFLVTALIAGTGSPA